MILKAEAGYTIEPPSKQTLKIALFMDRVILASTYKKVQLQHSIIILTTV
jgi:hypothetical protein